MANGSSFSGFDRIGRVIDLPWTKTTSGDLAQLKYGYDRVSNRTYRQDVRAASFGKKYDELYGYDNLQRLSSFDRGALDGSSLDRITTLTQRQSWQLDPTGNWNGFNNYDDQGGTFSALDQTRTQNTANEITAIGATVGDIWETPVHDRNGNMTTMPQPATPTAGYDGKYDAWNRLVEISETTTSYTVAEYEYDGLNRRTIKKKYDPPGMILETRDYYYSDNWQVLEEQVSSVAKEQFVWGLRYIDDLILRDRDTGTGLSDERLYALQDANWNVVALTNTSGAVQMRLVYEAYGTSTLLDPDFTPYTGATDYEWEYRFTGRRLDIGTGLYYYRERYYHARLGVFVTADPIGYRGGLNVYAYVRGWPTVAVDPLGLVGSAGVNWSYSESIQTLSPILQPNGKPYGGKISTTCCSSSQIAILKKETGEACWCIHRAVFALESMGPEVFNGPNRLIGVRADGVMARDGQHGEQHRFFLKTMKAILAACRGKTIRFKCGVLSSLLCKKEDTNMYVLAPLGVVVTGIHVCPLYFRKKMKNRSFSWGIIAHELARVYGGMLDNDASYKQQVRGGCPFDC